METCRLGLLNHQTHNLSDTFHTKSHNILPCSTTDLNTTSRTETGNPSDTDLYIKLLDCILSHLTIAPELSPLNIKMGNFIAANNKVDIYLTKSLTYFYQYWTGCCVLGDCVSAESFNPLVSAVILLKWKKGMFYLMIHSTYFIDSYKTSGMWLRIIQITGEEPALLLQFHRLLFLSTAGDLIYTPSHRQDSMLCQNKGYHYTPSQT